MTKKDKRKYYYVVLAFPKKKKRDKYFKGKRFPKDCEMVHAPIDMSGLDTNMENFFKKTI